MTSQGSVFAKAVAQHQAGQFADAARLFEQVVRGDPQHAAAWHHLGLVASALGRSEWGAACISRAVALDDSNALFQADLGAVLLELGRLDEAIECLEQAVQFAPDHAQAHYNLGLGLSRRGDWIGARLRFQHALRLYPEFFEAREQLAALCTTESATLPSPHFAPKPAAITEPVQSNSAMRPGA